MITVRISYEDREELDTVLESLRTIFDILKIKHTEKGRFKKAYILLEIKDSAKNE